MLESVLGLLGLLGCLTNLDTLFDCVNSFVEHVGAEAGLGVGIGSLGLLDQASRLVGGLLFVLSDLEHNNVIIKNGIELYLNLVRSTGKIWKF